MKFSTMLLLFWLLMLQCTGYNAPSAVAPPTPPSVEQTAKAPSVRLNRDSLISDSIDQVIFREKLRIAQQAPGGLRAKTLAVMRSFIGTPYISGTLDGYPTERLVINLRGLDCWTSVECCLALALTALDSTPDYAHYRNQVQNLRYRKGIIAGYGSRIHYFSDWILQNEPKGWFRDVTAELGGTPIKKNITYITDVPFYYPEANDPVAQQKIKLAQEQVSAHPWSYFPKQKVAAMTSKIEEGDILVFTSARPNLDVEHQGFAVKQQGNIYLLHASSTGKKVMISPKPLTNYLAGVAKMSGIMIVRIQDNGK